jgi:transposase InsO family protein
LRQQLLVLQRRYPRPRLSNADRRFWILASRWFGGWCRPLRIVRSETVLSPRASAGASGPHPAHGRRKLAMGSKANPSRVGEIGVQGVRQNRRQIYAAASQPRAIPGLEKIPKAARTEYLGLRFLLHSHNPIPDALCLLVIRLANREVLHVEVTRHPTAEWAVLQIVECCACDRRPPRFLIHDGDSRYGMSFDRRVRHLGIRQVRTPFRSPQADAIAERWVKSARTECLDHLLVFGEAISVERCRRIKPIIIIGARIDHFANVRPTVRECLIFGLRRPAARSSQSLYLADCITFTGAPHDGPFFCALHVRREIWANQISFMSRPHRDSIEIPRRVLVREVNSGYYEAE